MSARSSSERSPSMTTDTRVGATNSRVGSSLSKVSPQLWIWTPAHQSTCENISWWPRDFACGLQQSGAQARYTQGQKRGYGTTRTCDNGVIGNLGVDSLGNEVLEVLQDHRTVTRCPSARWVQCIISRTTRCIGQLSENGLTALIWRSATLVIPTRSMSAGSMSSCSHRGRRNGEQDKPERVPMGLQHHFHNAVSPSTCGGRCAASGWSTRVVGSMAVQAHGITVRENPQDGCKCRGCVGSDQHKQLTSILLDVVLKSLSLELTKGSNQGTARSVGGILAGASDSANLAVGGDGNVGEGEEDIPGLASLCVMDKDACQTLGLSRTNSWPNGRSNTATWLLA